jgi:hypothetical protein
MYTPEFRSSASVPRVGRFVGFEAFGAGGRLGSGAVTGFERAQAHLLFDAAVFGLGLLVVVVHPVATQVASDHGGEDVAVVVPVAYGDPAAFVRVSFGGEADGLDQAAGDRGRACICAGGKGFEGASGWRRSQVGSW